MDASVFSGMCRSVSMGVLIYVGQNIPTWAIIIGVILGVAVVTITILLVFFVACRLVQR